MKKKITTENKEMFAVYPQALLPAPNLMGTRDRRRKGRRPPSDDRGEDLHLIEE